MLCCSGANVDDPAPFSVNVHSSWFHSSRHPRGRIYIRRATVHDHVMKDGQRCTRFIYLAQFSSLRAHNLIKIVYVRDVTTIFEYKQIRARRVPEVFARRREVFRIIPVPGIREN